MRLLDGWKREREIRKVLRELERQRVCGFLQGDLWLVEHPIPTDNDALNTCRLRGWVEPMPGHKGIEKGNPSEARLPLYRLTDSGWNAIQSTHEWVVRTFIVAFATLVATVIGIVISRA